MEKYRVLILVFLIFGIYYSTKENLDCYYYDDGRNALKIKKSIFTLNKWCIDELANQGTESSGVCGSDNLNEIKINIPIKKLVGWSYSKETDYVAILRIDKTTLRGIYNSNNIRCKILNNLT
jgi:hypothetical protein